MKLYRNFFFILLGAFITTGSYAQFNLAGNAISTGGGCYTLTNSTGQSGAIWNTTQISLNQAFDITLTLNFGCNSTSDDFNLAPNCGGDGISFILQPNNTGVVGSGGQCGFGGITPSLGVVMDDYTNGPDDNATYDGTVDHISLNSNGDVLHGTGNELVAPSVGAGTGFPSEIENCNNYTFRFKWTPGSPNGTIQVWFNGALSFTYTGNVIANIFGGNPNVYWGVGGSTGACWNTQTVCMAIAADFAFTTACSGSATTFTNQSVSSSPITSYLWNFGDGQTSTLQNPTHVYATPGTYNVTLTITNSAGLTSTISNVVTVIGVTTTATASPASICTGASTTLTGTVTPNPATVNLYPSFTNTTDYAITDGGVTSGWTGTGGTFAQSNIAVSGINAGWSVNSVCLNINHTWDGDVIIYLKDPCGNLVQLCSGAGGSGDNFTNTCFTPTAATAITAGTAPFSGSYSPSGGAGIWTTLSGCATPNGTWSLLVGDQTSTDAGTLLDWTITFNNPVTATYTYAWNPGNITTTLTPVVTPAVTTTYTLTATTSLGCTSTSTVVVTVTPGPTITVNSPTICNGTTATLTANGGTTYAWSGGLGAGNPKTVTPAATTTYTVTGTTAGCSGTTTSVVTVNPLPTVTTTPATICAGATATISAAGANTYSWSSGGTGASTTVTPAATTTYTVTGTSAAGCTKTATCIVTVNPLPTVTTTPATICNGATATISAAGANTYAWSSGGTGASTTVTPTATTTYTVTGTSAAGCTNTATVVVTVNPLPTVTTIPATICAGTTATISAAGANTYAWSSGGTGTSTTVTPAATTTYTVTGTSAAGCTNTATVVVTVNPNPVVTVNNPSVCAGVTTTLTANGATTYSWSTGATTNPITVTPAVNTTYTVTGTTLGCTGTAISIVTISPNATITVNSPTLCAGQTATLTASGATTYVWTGGLTGNPATTSPAATTTYTVTGTTALGCTGTATSIVTINPNPVITVNSPTVCNGVTATLTANSTVGGTTYVWNGGSTANPYSVTPATTTTYTVTGTASGCTGTATTVVTVNPNPVVTVNNATICIAGTATLTAASTVGGTTYQWNTGSTNNPLTVSPALNTTYTVTGTAAGCTGTATASITITPNAIINVNAPVLCEGETATLNASGGVSYTWNTGANFNPITVTPATTTTYSVTGTDASGCVGSTTAIVIVNPNPIVTTTPSVICAGQSATLTVLGATNYTWNTGSTANPYIVTPLVTTTYSVTGTTLGCTGSASGVVTVNPNPTVTVNNAAICAGFTTTLNANGAAGYNWSSGETTASINVSPAVTTTYTITGTTLGCTGTATSVVTVYMNPTPAVTTTDEHCGQSDGTATATAGFANYAWTPAGATQSLTGLSANTYTVTVTDTYGCVGTASGTVGFVNGPTAQWGTVTQETCTAGNGLLTANVNGGTPTYVYTWSPAGSSTNTYANLHAGSYALTITDNWGCTVLLDTSITDRPAPVLSVGSITPASCGSSDGGATLNVNLGTPVFQFLWSNSNTNQNLQNTAAGYYSVTVTDASGCTGTIGLTINELAGPGVTASGQTAFCGLPNGSAIATGTGGSGNYTYLWSHGPTTSSVSGLSAGTYFVTVTDGNCSASTSVSIGDIAGPNADFSFTPQTVGIDQPEVTFSDNSSGGPVQWEWEFGDGSTSATQNPIYSYTAEGTYTIILTVENSMGCRDSTTRTIIVKGDILIWVPNAFTPNNDGLNDTFGPKGTGIDPDRYQLYVYTRWGEQIFASTDINLQWDGRYKGNIVKPDTYVWLIVYKGEMDKMQKLEGHVTVVK